MLFNTYSTEPVPKDNHGFVSQKKKKIHIKPLWRESFNAYVLCLSKKENA
jgi:hypothetical protein